MKIPFLVTNKKMKKKTATRSPQAAAAAARTAYTTRNVLINDDSLVTITNFVTEY
jgi:hypothetical protein